MIFIFENGKLFDKMNKFSSVFIENGIFGKYPDADELSLIIKEKIKLIVNLTSEEECLPDYSLPDDIEQIKYPILDKCSPNANDPKFQEMIETIVMRIKCGQKVYIHCRGGHGRAGVISAIVLSKLLPDLTSTQILSSINKAHSKRTEMLQKWRKMGSPQTKIQKDFVKHYITQK